MFGRLIEGCGCFPKIDPDGSKVPILVFAAAGLNAKDETDDDEAAFSGL